MKALLYLCPPWGRAGGGVGGVRQVRIDWTSGRVKLACDCDGDGGDDNDGDDDDDDDDDDNIYYDAVFVCSSRKIITSHFRAERRRHEVSSPLGLGPVIIMMMTMMMTGPL